MSSAKTQTNYGEIQTSCENTRTSCGKTRTSSANTRTNLEETRTSSANTQTNLEETRTSSEVFQTIPNLFKTVSKFFTRSSQAAKVFGDCGIFNRVVQINTLNMLITAMIAGVAIAAISTTLWRSGMMQPFKPMNFTHIT